jgi:inositol transport system ATP-binding protein
MQEEIAIEVKGISKSFPGVVALDRVSLNVRRGEVHALMGENGAGKSTLMKILAGIYTPDEGEIYIKGNKETLSNPKDALEKGISMIHQELNAVPEMSAAENIFLGREPMYKYLGVVNQREMKEQTAILFEEMELNVDPGRVMSSLSIAEMQMVEIAKAVLYNSDIIIMDEPTSAITDREVEILFKLIDKLKRGGKAIIYISHKMDEISRISDRITVLRDGIYIDTKPASEMTSKQLISMMVGRDLNQMFDKDQVELGEVYLEVQQATRQGKFEAIDFSVRKGEILGIAGLMGAGRTELVESIFGMFPLDSGKIFIQGKPVVIRTPKDAIMEGLALVTEDRKLLGLNLKAAVRDNITIVNLNRYVKFKQIISSREERKAASFQIQSLNIKTPSQNTIINTLSGGNQQKAVIAKWLLRDPDLLILDEPTRGIDIGAKAEIYKIINQLAKNGKAILMISSELPELIGMSDRIMVLHNGRKTREFRRGEFNQEDIMTYATGHIKEDKP